MSIRNYRIYPWFIVWMSALFLFYKYIIQISPSIMTQELMEAFSIHATGLGNLAATFFYSYSITQLFVGLMLDKISPRFLSSMAIVMGALGTYGFALSHHIISAGIARSFMGIGAAFATVSYMKLTAHWFKPQQFAFVGGLLATAAMLGAFFGQAPLALMMHHLGWRQTLIVCAWVGIAIAIVFFIVVRDQPKDTLYTYAKRHTIHFHDVWCVFKKRHNWLLALYNGLAFTPVAVLGGLWGNPFLIQAYSLSSTESAGFISLIFLGLACGGPILGFISGTWSIRWQIMLLGAVLAFIAATCAIYIHCSLVLLGLFLFLFGFGTGAFMLGFAVGKELNPLAVSATVIALINTGDGLFGACTEPLIGKLLDLNWHGVMNHGAYVFDLNAYQHAFFIIPIYLILSVVLVFVMRRDIQGAIDKSHSKNH